jgi:hypothetical protein
MDIVDERGLAVDDVGSDGDVEQSLGRDRVVVGLGLRGRGNELPDGASPLPQRGSERDRRCAPREAAGRQLRHHEGICQRRRKHCDGGDERKRRARHAPP